MHTSLVMDEFEQDKHSKCVQIVGLSENKNDSEDIKQLTKVFKEKAGVKIRSSDVVDMRRMGKKSNQDKKYHLEV